LIEVRDLVKRYGDITAVDKLSFKVEKGQIYGFLGPNGAGKTTTMNIMTGYLGATEGEVIINGYSIIKEPEKAKRCIGYLPEQPPLYTDMTPWEYLVFAAELKGLPKSGISDAVGEVMAMTQIEDVQDRLIKNLSKGYRQRVGLAQAILGMPDIIILDEPTVGLDPKQIHEIRELIRSLAGEHTVILSSHILSEVREICDHILIIHHGKLVAAGTPEELEKQLRHSALVLTVRSGDGAAVEKLLGAVDGVSAVTCVPAGEKELSVTVEPKENRDLREAIFYACAGAKCPILMMKPAGVTLESVFLELTTDNAPADHAQVEKQSDDTSEDVPEAKVLFKPRKKAKPKEGENS
jgi:ABC-2 type transport system ATP-binding protein